MKIKILNPQDGYSLIADYYNKKNDYWDSFEKGRVLPLLGNVEGLKILDVGGGNGRLAVKLVEIGGDVTVVDVSEEMIKNIKIKSSKLKTVIGDAESLPFENESFDIVIATFLIVHLKDLRLFFDEAYRVLKPGGKFLLTNINQRKAPAVKTEKGLVEIESYYHRPEAVIEKLQELAFSVEENKFVKERGVWINQIILASK